MKKTILMFLLVLSSVMNAQNDKIKISGKVLDNTGQGIPNATVSADGNSVVTDIDGKYAITVNNTKSIVTFSYLGFDSKTATVGKNTIVNVTLQESNNVLDEIVVVGYGTQKRSSVTGSVAKLKSDKIENAPVSRLDQAIQGKIAGVRVQNISSEAGATTQINIRGISSVNAGSGPLIVVDGQPMPDGMGSINNADVESVEVLKDAASAAIYGSRGAGGVILVTTKKGKEGKTKFKFSNTTGVKSAYETYDVMSSTDYVNLLYSESDLRIADPQFFTYDKNGVSTIKTIDNTIGSLGKFQSQYAIEKELLGGVGTDWQDKALRTAFYQDVQFNVSGGGKKNTFYISTGYQNDEGLMLKSNFQKLNFRLKFDSQLTDKIKINVNLNPSNTKTEKPAANFIDFARFPSFMPVYHNQTTADYINAQDPSRNIKVGDFAEDDDFSGISYTSIDPQGNPYTVTNSTNNRPFNTSNTNPMRNLTQQDDNNNEFRFQGSAGVNFELAKGLDFKTTQSVYVRNSARKQTGETNAARFGNPNYATYTNSSYFDFLTENTLNYNKSIGDHDFTALGGFTYESTNTKSLVTAGTTFSSETIRNLNYATVILQPVQSNTTVGLTSFLGRLNYAYKNKYLLSASYRTDGSSLFDVGNKWGGFPAVSLGWVVSKENFLADVSSINRLAFRASYGATGNNAITPYLYQETLNSSNYVSGTGNGTVSTGLANLASVYSNKDITWERTFQTNLGFDLSMFRSRMNLNIDVFQSNTEKLLLENSALLTTGSSTIITNAGSLKNSGFEIELSTVNVKTKDFTWSTDFNISHVKNKITELGDKTSLISPTIDGRNGLNNYAIVGQPLISYFGYKTDGVWNSTADINAAKANGLSSTLTGDLVEGGLKIVDTNGDKVIDSNDRVILGNPYPDYTWGITNNFSYKNLDLNFTLQGVMGGELINGDINYNEIKERVTNYMGNRWVSPSNPGDGNTPYLTNGVNPLFTDNAVEDATYFTLREVSLGYNFNAKNLKLSTLRLSLTGQNLLFVTNNQYRGINIEARTSQTSPLIDGYQRGGFPIQRTILFGVEVGF
ncbi:TonB-linked SusC/RagA family outer membrane protein [Flavobacterium sp. 7E]|uniref:SusC/RagA family TonB-linked outer membrane protein n=1 Tax=Flavobacterium sp. 7E TaxID=2735898 RepID=UPI00156E18A8|nr:SusC/RagA family TonB-linked outer membrane protein [Flavobacterium sp. 7E]NRS88045.1 TonB-linked SusC/RagA family outer membrane protein [Flavobacterium sp. 7E]